MKKNTSSALLGTAEGAAGTMHGTDAALFVINLCTSMAPIPVPGKTLPGLEVYRLYQVMRIEDGRTRYRLRLGFFSTKADADAALVRVRDAYPTAFATCMASEDQKFARAFFANTPQAARQQAATTAARPQSQPAAASTPPKPAPAAQPAPQTAARAAKTPAAAAPAPKTPAARPTAASRPAPASPASTTSEVIEVEVSWTPPQPTTPAAASKRSVQQTSAGQPPGQVPAGAPRASAQATRTAARNGASPPARKAPAQAPSEVVELTLEPEAPAKAAPSTQPAPTSPPGAFHVGKGAQIPDVSLDLQADTGPAPRPAARRSGPAEPFHVGRSADPDSLHNAAAMSLETDAASQPDHPPAAGAPGAPMAAPPGAPARQGEPRVPELDSTQTIRALTAAELEDESQEKWFAIQLAVSEQPVNLETMPRLDIFEAYRLYSVANAAHGKILHHLRLGFFREQVSAEAVAGYLQTFFPDPKAIRVSAAEQKRFNDPPARRPNGPVDPQAKANVIELSEARERRPAIPTVTLEVDRSRIDPNATGSFKPNASGSFRLAQTGKNKVLTPALKPAKPKAAKHGARGALKSTTGKNRSRMSLDEALLEEARQVELSESGIHPLPKNNSLFSRLLGKRR